MEREDIDKILSEVDVLVEDPRFYPRIFHSLSKRRRKKFAKIGDNFKRILAEEYENISTRVDEAELQESCSVRNVLKTRRLAKLLVDDDGKLNLSLIPRVIKSVKAHQYSLGPNRQYDAKRHEYLIRVLTLLQENKQLARQLSTIGRPHMHCYADEIIRETLQLPPKTVITDAHARRAVLSAWMCYLRQNVGSCFATAPAIIIQEEQPETFLRDLQELLTTGRLKRTFGGVEYAVPLSYSWGAGDLRRSFLFEKSRYQEDLTLWRSPGLIAALEAVEIIDIELPQKEKEAILKKKMVNVIANWKTDRQWFFTTVEALLRKIILDHLGLTEEDIQEYELRPKGMIQGGFLMQAPFPSEKTGGQGQKCVHFLTLFETASNIFKALADNALLKSWEFSLASFAETKSQFTRWNLYSSLGLGPQDKGGIGPCLYEILKQRLDECNRKVQEYNEEYEVLHTQLQFLHRRLQSASSEREAKWAKIEYQTKANEFHTLEELRNRFHNKARRYANFFDGLVDLYYRLFPNYFQEIYDADIHEVTSGPYDDSPAGFRLLYKYGRSNTSQWTRIHNHTEFIDALANFFTATESELVNAPEMSGLEDDLAEIVTAIVSHVRSEEFLETAFHRMAAAHGSRIIKDPLKHMDQVEKKPWVYTSGGAMNTLVSCYFRLEAKPKEVSRWVENSMELLVFLVDTIKEMPEKVQDEIVLNPEKSILIHSPTHAFQLKPGYPLFRKAWQNKDFTYTWVRDKIVRPMEIFSELIYLDDERMQFVIDAMREQVPKNFRPYFKDTFRNIGGSMQVSDFRQHIVDSIELTPGLQYAGRGVLSPGQVDSILYSLLPLIPSYKLKERVEKIVSKLPGLSKEIRDRLLTILSDISGRIGSQQTISARGLQDIVKAMLALVLGTTSTVHDYPFLIAKIAQEEEFAMPAPFIFADTNWVKDYFSFVINPGNGRFELWRTDYTGRRGVPMSDWKMWLNGTKKQPDWGIYNNPYEYKLAF